MIFIEYKRSIEQVSILESDGFGCCLPCYSDIDVGPKRQSETDIVSVDAIWSNLTRSRSSQPDN